MRARRRAISSDISVWSDFQKWEESCVPAYCHPNFVAAWVSWSRLFRAVELVRADGMSGPVLDFGSSIGEVGRLIEPSLDYHFIERDSAPAEYLLRTLPGSTQVTLDSASDQAYGCVFALDSLEHNEGYAALLERLAGKLAPGGTLVLSGPTENWLYRIGRRLSGFDSHYHLTNITHIENAAAKHLVLKRRATVPLGVPLFRISAWMRSPLQS